MSGPLYYKVVVEVMVFRFNCSFKLIFIIHMDNILLHFTISYEIKVTQRNIRSEYSKHRCGRTKYREFVSHGHHVLRKRQPIMTSDHPLPQPIERRRVCHAGQRFSHDRRFNHPTTANQQRTFPFRSLFSCGQTRIIS